MVRPLPSLRSMLMFLMQVYLWSIVGLAVLALVVNVATNWGQGSN